MTKALISLRGCAGWSAPVLFANHRRQVFSRQALISLRGCVGWSAPVLFANHRKQVFSRQGPIYNAWFRCPTLAVQYSGSTNWTISYQPKMELNYVMTLIARRPNAQPRGCKLFSCSTQTEHEISFKKCKMLLRFLLLSNSQIMYLSR